VSSEEKKKNLYAVFDIKGKKRKFVRCTKAKSSTQAVAFVSRSYGHWERLHAELTTPELLKKLKKSTARLEVLWQAYDGDGFEVGNSTSAVSEKEATSHVWCGLVKPDKKPPTEEEKERLHQMTAKPKFGQPNPWRRLSNHKSVSARQGSLFPC
jgi:hypothetical protein